jgi:signal transduction histidine kinase
MIVRFRNLSLTAKLFLLGIIPVLFLIYFSWIIYHEKFQKVDLIGSYIKHIEQSQKVMGLVAELTRERRYSYFFILGDSGFKPLLQHRKKTDSVLLLLSISKDPSYKDFQQYTFLDKLDSVRSLIDSNKINPNGVTEYYTDAIIRLNLLTSSIPANSFLKPVYNEIVAQKKLSDMITYLGIVRTNVFNLLLNQTNTFQTLAETNRSYKLFNSYEKEFLLKAPVDKVKKYNQFKTTPDYEATLNYLYRTFNTLKLDSTYSSRNFWAISSNSMSGLRKQQQEIWQRANIKMENIYHQERNSEKKMIAFLIFAILIVVGFIVYVINHIHKLLTEIKLAASKISIGATGIRLKNMPKGIIGNLAKSIIEIDKNNLELAKNANEIGKGNFDVKVTPRSEHDILGISIKKMKNDLLQFNRQKDKIQRDTETLVYRRDEFFSIASHELKTPVTSLKAYTQLLLMDADKFLDEHHKSMLQRMEGQINKLTALINDLLDTSKIENEQMVFNNELFILNDLASEVVSDMQPVCKSQEIIFRSGRPASVYADKERIRQVISNLISNANKYASKSSKIILSIETLEEKVICSVQDFGKGIEAEEQEKIFERFYRVSGPNMNTFPGLGLGLFICKQVIEKQNGKIGLKSTPGKGSTFYFELPLSSFAGLNEDVVNG